eukprot:jgi/Bigna1/87846/estExt_fgenesh1_pg.C_250010
MGALLPFKGFIILNGFGPLEVFYSVIITIVICVACATTVIIAEGRDGRMASLSTIKSGVMPSKATESEAETIRRKLLSSYVRRLRAGGRENGSGNGGEESEKQNDKEKEEDDEEKDYKEKAGGEDNKATAPLLLPDLVDYSKEGTLDYSKFDKIIDSSDDEAMDDISEERIQAAKKELEEVEKDAAANGGNDTETYMMNMLRLKREKERKVARLEEEENKRLCVQTPNKWNGGKTNLYSFRQHIKNIEVYINMSATAIPGPYRGKNFDVKWRPNGIDISYQPDGMRLSKNSDVLSAKKCLIMVQPSVLAAMKHLSSNISSFLGKVWKISPRYSLRGFPLDLGDCP